MTRDQRTAIFVALVGLAWYFGKRATTVAAPLDPSGGDVMRAWRQQPIYAGGPIGSTGLYDPAHPEAGLIYAVPSGNATPTPTRPSTTRPTDGGARCYQPQCFAAPCYPICDGHPVIDGEIIGPMLITSAPDCPPGANCA